MTPEVYLVYLGVLAAFFATPPDTSQLLVMSNSLRHGVRRTCWTVAGDLSANVLQMTAAGLGLAAIVATSAAVLAWVKWAGVAYLCWLGLRLILATGDSRRPGGAALPRRRALFRQGFLTSSANPYAVVFFGALFPQFIDPAAALAPQLAVLGGTYLLVDGVILLVWGLVAEQALGRLRWLTGGWLNRISGGLMIAAAVLLGSRDISGVAR